MTAATTIPKFVDMTQGLDKAVHTLYPRITVVSTVVCRVTSTRHRPGSENLGTPPPNNPPYGETTPSSLGVHRLQIVYCLRTVVRYPRAGR